MRTIGIIVVTALFVALSSLWSGFVFSKLWAWFITPTFDAKAITMAQSVGIMFVWSSLKARMPERKDPRPFAETMPEIVAFAFLHWLFVLVLGAIYHAIIF